MWKSNATTLLNTSPQLSPCLLQAGQHSSELLFLSFWPVGRKKGKTTNAVTINLFVFSSRLFRQTVKFMLCIFFLHLCIFFHTFSSCSGFTPYLPTFLLVCHCLPSWAAMIYTSNFALLVPKGYLSFLIHRIAILLTLPPTPHPTHHSAGGRWALPCPQAPCMGGWQPKPPMEKELVPPNQAPSWDPLTSPGSLLDPLHSLYIDIQEKETQPTRLLGFKVQASSEELL